MIVMMKANKGILHLFQRKDFMPFEECWNFLNTFTDDIIPPMSIGVPMKHSKYTIEKLKGRTYVLYNTLYNSMLTMSDTEFQQYRTLDFQELSLIEPLVDNGFLIPVYTDEFERYNYYKNGLLEFYPSFAHYTIALTTKCNARCFYCYEEGVCQKDMSLQTAEKLAELLLKTSREINLTWFGGEPLIKTDTIDVISRILNRNGKDFRSDIITNGSLLNEEIITDKFKEWHITHVQITIDGMEEEYLKRKNYYNSKNVFDKILKNIDILVQNNILVSIRLNIDSDNNDECVKVTEFFKNRYSDNVNIVVYPSFLTGERNSINDMYSRTECLKSIYTIYEPEIAILTFQPKLEACFFEQTGAFVIDSDGSILCCDRDIGKQNTKISDIYSIQNFDDLQKPDSIIPKVRSECRKCVYYPKCGGGCRAAYSFKNKYDACFMDRYKTDFWINKILGI